MRFRELLWTLLAGTVMTGSSSAGLIESNSILATQGNVLLELSSSGVVRQSFNVPHPDTSRYEATDVVVGPDGRIHVLTFAPFSGDYLNTLDPLTGTWTFTPLPHDTALSNVADGGLSGRGRTAFGGGARFDLLNLSAFQNPPLSVSGFNGPSEINFGLNGLLYAVNAGSPQHDLLLLHPDGFDVLDRLELRNESGIRLDARGVAATRLGDLFVADWNGIIYHFAADGQLRNSIATGASNLLDINLHPDGTIIAGSRFGDVIVTDTSLDSVRRFSVGRGLTYVGFAEPIPAVPEPSSAALLVLGLMGGVFGLRRRSARR